MDLSAETIGEAVQEGELYFVKYGCSFGVADHPHVCIKRNGQVLLLSTCSSQTDTAIRLAKLNHFDSDTYPVFKKDSVNKLWKDETYVDCNKVWEIDEIQFGEYIKNGEIELMAGVIDAAGMQRIANGIKKSTQLSRRIQSLF